MQHVHGYEISMSSVGVGILKKKSVGVGQCSYLLIPIWEICEAPHIPKQASKQASQTWEKLRAVTPCHVERDGQYNHI